MRSYLVMGLFALFVVAVSLFRCLADEEFFRLTAMKRLWGRSRGLLMFFLANVALPMVLGIVFVTRGIIAPGGLGTTVEGDFTSPMVTVVRAEAPPAFPDPAATPDDAFPVPHEGPFPTWFNIP